MGSFAGAKLLKALRGLSVPRSGTTWALGARYLNPLR